MDLLGSFVAQRARAVLAVMVIVLTAAGAFGLGVFGELKAGGFTDPASDSVFQTEESMRVFGPTKPDVLVVYGSDDLTVDDPEFTDELTRVTGVLTDDRAARVVTYQPGMPPEQAAAVVSADRSSVLVMVTLAGDSEDARSKNFDAVAPELRSQVLTTHIAGPLAVFEDVTDTAISDITRAEMIALPIVFLLSVVIFGSLVAATMPVLVGVCAVAGAFAIVRLLTLVMDVSVFSINLITVLGMGLAVDYALFIVSRFREEMRRAADPGPQEVRQAVKVTMATAGRTVVFSALVVAAAMASLLVFPVPFLSSMGWGGVAAVLVAMVSAVTVLPAVLCLLGPRLDAGRVPWQRRAAAAGADQTPTNTRWAKWAQAMMRRPIMVVVLTTTLLLSLGAPFLGAKWGGIDTRVLPEDSPSRQAASVLQDEFGIGGMQADVLVRGADQAELSAYVSMLGAVHDEAQAQVVNVSEDTENALVQVTWPGEGADTAAQQVLRDIREVPVPSDSQVWVGGAVAETVDLLTAVGQSLPWMVAVVVAVMLVLLFLAFGSIVLPLKAVVMSVVSLGASFGVVAWIFSDGNLSGLLDFTPIGYLDSTQPILMLAIIFGLSMDYEVFLLSRVREEWDRTGNNEVAVAAGVQQTGSIITSAALLLGVVIGAFAAADVQVMKLMGIGMLVAVLIDATVVRAMLVPATMRLLGAWNWWAPAPMARWWQKYGHREGGIAAGAVEHGALVAVAEVPGDAANRGTGEAGQPSVEPRSQQP